MANRTRAGLLVGAALALVSANAFASEYACTPTTVCVYGNRIHVTCTGAPTANGSTIYFWAVSTSNAETANRFLSMASTALVAKRTMAMSYTTTDTSGASFGCAASDCRNVWAFELR